MGPAMETQVTVHVVDDDQAVRDSLRFLLELEGMAVRTYHSAGALLGAELAPAGCVLTDFQMPEMDGLQLQARLAAQGIGLPVIVMTGHGDVPVAVRAMKAGAVDFLEKPFADGQLLDAVGRALEHNRKALDAAGMATKAAGRIALLTPREREVLDLVVAGKPNKEIARILGTSPRTIDVHRARVFQKLQADSLPDLVHLVLLARAAGPPG
jgi:two-component system response regulator FixJ